MVMVPASFEYAPIKILIKVDFPAPFSPTKPCTSPALTPKLTPFRARTPGKLLWMSVMETIVALDCSGMSVSDRKRKTRSIRCVRMHARTGRVLDPALLRLPLQAGRVQEIQDILVVHVRLRDCNDAGVNVFGH